jgi:hypothetical protein
MKQIMDFKRNLRGCFLLTVLMGVLVSACAVEAGRRGGGGGGFQEIRPASESIVAARYGKSLRRETGGIPILVLSGTYEEMGEAHGVLGGSEIMKALDRTLIPYVNRAKPGAWDRLVLPAARAVRFPDRFEAELGGMIKGIESRFPKRADRMLFSAGREISVDDLRALSCMDDIMEVLRGGCSSFSAWGKLTPDGSVICGRNLDYRTLPGLSPVVVIARKPAEAGRQATIEIGSPGYIGATTAMNSDGIFIMIHHEGGLRSARPEKWLPRGIILRDAIEKMRVSDSIEEIARIFRNQPAIMGNNTHIAFPVKPDQGRLLPLVVEWDGNTHESGATLRSGETENAPEATICTNHYIRRRSAASGSAESRERFDTLAGLVRGFHLSGGKIGLEEAVMMMESVAERGEMVTYLTAIAFPDTRRIVFAVTPGSGVPATEGKWIGIGWEELFEKE